MNIAARYWRSIEVRHARFSPPSIGRRSARAVGAFHVSPGR
jgi:hypothetical protein